MKKNSARFDQDLVENGPYPVELQEFFARLNSKPGAKDLKFLQRELATLQADKKMLKKWMIFDEDCYKRNLIYRNQDFELLLLTWKSGQRSPIHNHRGSSCAICVVQGIASEILFEEAACGSLYPTVTQHVSTGKCSGSVDHEIHQVVNLQPTGKDLASLHVYSPPLRAMEVLSLSETTFSEYDDLIIHSSRKAAA